MKLRLLLLISIILSIKCEDIIDDAVVIKNRVWEGYETGVGAHYYAYSPYQTGYSTVTTYVQLPESVNTNGGKRNAYISLGVLGLYGALDTGIMNSGEGWLPFYYDVKKHEFVTFKDHMAPEGTTIVGIEILVTQDRVVVFKLSYRNSDLEILSSFECQHDASHFLVYEDNMVKNRFYRFASLVPVEKDDQNDGTYMIGGKFTGLTIVKNGEAQSWGIATDNIDVAWLVSSKRIQYYYVDNMDSFSIIHKPSEPQ